MRDIRHVHIARSVANVLPLWRSYRVGGYQTWWAPTGTKRVVVAIGGADDVGRVRVSTTVDGHPVVLAEWQHPEVDGLAGLIREAIA